MNIALSKRTTAIIVLDVLSLIRPFRHSLSMSALVCVEAKTRVLGIYRLDGQSRHCLQRHSIFFCQSQKVVQADQGALLAVVASALALSWSAANRPALENEILLVRSVRAVFDVRGIFQSPCPALVAYRPFW